MKLELLENCIWHTLDLNAGVEFDIEFLYMTFCHLCILMSVLIPISIDEHERYLDIASYENNSHISFNGSSN